MSVGSVALQGGAAARLMRLRGVRAHSTLTIPPKIATPKSVQGPGGSSARMDGVVSFYKALPKGDAPQRRGGGIKARYFDGKNASGKPIVATLFALFLIGYSIDYATHLRTYSSRLSARPTATY
jgi:F-type H+-transporting ATPase subunit f